MILCIGEAVIDMFQKNVSGYGDIFMPLPGGCCYNTSIAVGALGVPCAFLGRLSKNFFGDIQVKRLKDFNVKDDLLIRCDENPVLAFIKTEEGKEPQYAFYDEGTADRPLCAQDIPPALSPEIKCIVFGSISMNMKPAASTIESLILTEASKNEAQRRVIAFDPNIRPFMIKDRDAYIKRFEKLISVCTVAKISSEDFEYIYPDTPAENALEKIIALGARLAIVTLGAGGACALLNRGSGNVIKVSCSGINTAQLKTNANAASAANAASDANEQAADTVGAGDTFHGAFLARLHLRGKLSPNAVAALSEDDLCDALSFANKAAAIVCTRAGANPPSLQEIENCI